MNKELFNGLPEDLSDGDNKLIKQMELKNILFDSSASPYDLINFFDCIPDDDYAFWQDIRERIVLAYRLPFFRGDIRNLDKLSSLSELKRVILFLKNDLRKQIALADQSQPKTREEMLKFLKTTEAPSSLIYNVRFLDSESLDIFIKKFFENI